MDVVKLSDEMITFIKVIAIFFLLFLLFVFILAILQCCCSIELNICFNNRNKNKCRKIMKTKKWNKCKDKECNICLEDFDEKKKIKSLRCGHLFHKTCILNSLSQKQECPVCRQNVKKAKKLSVRETKLILYY